VVMSLFERAREDPAAAYEPDRFLAFLTTRPPMRGKRVADTFAARRRFVRFMESVQLELGVCFSNEEWDRGFALDEFVALVSAKAAKPQLSLRLARQHLQGAKVRRLDDPIKFGVLALPLLVGAVAVSNVIIQVAAATLWVVIVGGVAWFANGERRYLARLIKRVDGGAA